jgi:hypothetical protein
MLVIPQFISNALEQVKGRQFPGSGELLMVIIWSFGS